MTSYRDHDDNATDDANRWLKLKHLVGYVGDGSNVTVKLFWDDATNTPFIVVDKKSYYIDRGSLDSVIDSIPEWEPMKSYRK